MKKLSILWLALLALTFGFTFTACDDDDDDNSTPTPTETTGTLQITISGLAAGDDANVSITGPDGFSETITGSQTFADVMTGSYTVTVNEVTGADGFTYIAPNNATASVTVTEDQTTTAEVSYQAEWEVQGIIGECLSEGANVAPLLAAEPLLITSVTAEFRDNNTYEVVSTDQSGAQITFTGSYIIEASGTDDIFNITLNQSTPAEVQSEGIFAIGLVDGAVLMQYEVAQTVPSIQGVTPPTAEAGFGSTSGGALGTFNVQRFVRQ